MPDAYQQNIKKLQVFSVEFGRLDDQQKVIYHVAVPKSDDVDLAIGKATALFTTDFMQAKGHGLVDKKAATELLKAKKNLNTNWQITRASASMFVFL